MQGRVLATSLASAHQMTVTTKTVLYGAKCHGGGRRTKSPKPLSQPCLPWGADGLPGGFITRPAAGFLQRLVGNMQTPSRFKGQQPRGPAWCQRDTVGAHVTRAPPDCTAPPWGQRRSQVEAFLLGVGFTRPRKQAQVSQPSEDSRGPGTRGLALRPGRLTGTFPEPLCPAFSRACSLRPFSGGKMRMSVHPTPISWLPSSQAVHQGT